ncbi:hypothetical protein IAU60_003481 [Kwoniella sp. DSM 27419]
MFGSSLQDRLNAAVKTLEATGSSLQAKALSVNANPAANGNASVGNAPASPKEGGAARAVSPNTLKTSLPGSPLATPTTEKKRADGSVLLSPTKTGTSAAGYVGSTAHLAENALSGLRKSFHFGRSSTDLTRPATASPTINTSSPQQELKNLASPTSPAAAAGPSSRPVSPIPRLLGASDFALGSDPSSRSATPTPAPRSPVGNKPSKLALAPVTPLPPPDPADPATYPLPPSPTLSSSDALEVPPTGFSDPLGASPILAAESERDVPELGLQAATPEKENPEGIVGLGISDLKGDGSVDEPAPGENASSVTERSEGEQAKLLEAERRYEDLSKRFTTLLTQSHNANKVLKDLTPLEGGIADHEAMEGWIRMMNGKVEMLTAEMKRLQDKLTLQDSRMEELRDTHRLEGSSQSELISKLRAELSEAQAKANTASSDAGAVTQLRADLTKAQTQAKEEEEKRTKAISLLKTVRLKLVKVEKEKEEVERDRAEERAERSRAGEDLERMKAEKEREVTQLRKGFERELASAKERFEKDLQSKKAAWELEMITTKASHAKDQSAKSTKINGLESIVKELNLNKSKAFESLQAKQAEAETARSEMEVLQTRTKELEFQLREANERCALLEDSVRNSRPGRGRGVSGVADSLRAEDQSPSPSPSRRNSFSNGATSSAEVQRLLAEAEARSEAKLSDLRFKLRSLETERNEIEEEWSTKLSERVRELEKLRRQVQEKEMEYAESVRGLSERERKIEDSEEKARGLERELIKLRTRIEEGKGEVAVAAEAERSAREELSTVQVQINTLQAQLDESKAHVTNLKTNNKTLRDELRKVQSSVQLMERQRNPGVGYWSSSNPGAGVNRSSVSSPIPLPTPSVSGTESPNMESASRKSLDSVATSARGGAQTPSTPQAVAGSPATPVAGQDEEEVNLEYLRNVILQFLEHKEMRPNLVRVMSVILRFTPQELRRLNAKLQT